MNEDTSRNCHRIELRKYFTIAGDSSNPINRPITKISISFLCKRKRASALCLIHLHLNLKHRFKKYKWVNITRWMYF